MSSEENKSLMLRFYEEVMNQGNLAFIDEVCSPEYVEHDDDTPTPDREGLKLHVAAIRRGFPDLQVTVQDIIVDADKVAVRTKMSATHTGEFMGLPPTGRETSISGMDVVRFSNGRIVEHWGMIDSLALMQQMGLVPAPTA